MDASWLAGPREVGSLVPQINSFPPQQAAGIFFCPFPLCWIKDRTYGMYQPKPPSLIFLREANLCRTSQSSKTIKTEAIFLGKPLRKLGVLGAWTNPFPSLGKTGGQGISSWSHGTTPEIGVLKENIPNFLLAPLSLVSHSLRYRSLSISVWISHKGNFSINYCWISMFMGREGFRAFHLPILLLSPIFWLHCLLEITCALGQFEK